MVDEASKQEKTDYPLSPKDWIFLLYSDINRLNTARNALLIFCLTVMLVILGFYLADTGDDLFVPCICITVALILCEVYAVYDFDKKAKIRYEIIKRIIAGEMNPKQILDEALPLIGQLY